MWWTSLLPFLSDVLVYWWILIPGVAAEFAWVIGIFWDGYDEWAEKHFDRARRRKLARRLAVLGLFVAMFLAYHHERTERLRLAGSGTATSANVCGAALENLGQSDGPGTIGRLVRVTASRQTPYGVTFTARGPGLEKFRVSPRDHRRLEVFSEKSLPDGKSIFISEPRGLFDVFITAKNPDAIVFGYEFECEG